MVMRCSFALDPGLLEQIDQFARDHAFDRNEAILELIEAGLVCQKDGKMPPPVRQQHSSEELNVLQRELEDIKEISLSSVTRFGWSITRSRPTGTRRQRVFRSRQNIPWEFWRK